VGDARADDTADASTVATTLGSACAPDGYEIMLHSSLPGAARENAVKQGTLMSECLFSVTLDSWLEGKRVWWVRVEHEDEARHCPTAD
jgi:hypothetical protein